MAKEKREPGKLAIWRTEVTIEVIGKLYASSPTTEEGIDAMLKANQPTSPQFDYRTALGESLKPAGELRQEIEEETLPEIAKTLEGGKSPSTVFRRDKEQKPFLHSNYLKGHLRGTGDTVGRMMRIWGLQDMITRTVLVCPERVYLDTEVKCLKTYFTPEVRTSQGITVKMPTEKVSEYVVDPKFTWILYIGADPRWNEELMESILTWGAMRGYGPGRGIDVSKYIFTMKRPWESLDHVTALKRYMDDFRKPGQAVFPAGEKMEKS